MRNRLKYWRHVLQVDTQKEYASLLGVKEPTLSQWLNQERQPSLKTLYDIYKILKTHLPDLHMEDLLEDDPE